MMRVAIAMLFLFGVSACTTITHVQSTQVMVVIDADQSVRESAASLDVMVVGPSGTPLMQPVSGVRFPLRVAVVPEGGDPTREFTVSATARSRTGTSLGTVRGRTRFVPGSLRELRLVIEGCCAALSCSTEQTCEDCTCATLVTSAPESLPTFVPGDAQVASDGSIAAPDADSIDASSVDADSVDASSVDASSVDATSVDASSIDASSPPCTPTSAPALLAPMNGAQTGRNGLRPRLRWRPESSCGTATRYQVQVDDSCTTPDFAACAFASPETALTEIAETFAQPATNLAVATSAPVGRRYYWRVRACATSGCGPWSAVRYLEVGRATSDIDGDGFSDALIAASNQNAATGVVYVFRGSAAGLATTSTTIASPESTTGGYFGADLDVTDLDADGFADLVVGSFSGRAYVYYGGASGLGALAVTLTDASEFVAAAGDVNADGFADLALGDKTARTVFVHHGRATPLSSTATTTILDPGTSGSEFSNNLATAGDVDADGYADLLVGARSASRAYLYAGGASGVSVAPTTTFSRPGEDLGSDLAYAGDLDGDGFSDVVIGAEGAARGTTSYDGVAYVHHGAPGGLSVTPTITLVNPVTSRNARFGSGVFTLGDVDGDGFDDLVVSSANAYGASGVVYVFAGSASGVPAAPTRTYLHPTALPNARFRQAVSIDFDGDGLLDLLMSAGTQDIGGISRVGRVFVYRGVGAAFPPTTPTSTLDHPTPQHDAQFGRIAPW
ncbi:MAG: VCBS repeat-containing protein [Deltaproteobacteria bacterium]|nr:VCBS repeat-containing protein [Deltaproteobacteria bacterium]